jgi:tRNA(Ile)-lysidine synthase
MSPSCLGSLEVDERAATLLATLGARCTFADGDGPIDVACSGGPDSTGLAALAVATGRRVLLHHVDHGLRPGSGAEAAHVASTARLLGAAFVGHAIEVGPGQGPEDAARIARFSVLPHGAATGHTLDDQAETLLLNLVRGAGSRGLGAMAPGPTHPVLGLRRAELAALVAALGLAVIVDPSNDDLRLRRNAVRHRLVPLLDEIAERDVTVVLARSADHARADEAFLEELARAAVPDPTDVAALRSAAGPVAARAVRRWLLEVRGVHQASTAEVDRVLAVVRHEAKSTELVGGGRVARVAGHLRYDPA